MIFAVFIVEYLHTKHYIDYIPHSIIKLTKFILFFSNSPRLLFLGPFIGEFKWQTKLYAVTLIWFQQAQEFDIRTLFRNNCCILFKGVYHISEFIPWNLYQITLIIYILIIVVLYNKATTREILLWMGFTNESPLLDCATLQVSTSQYAWQNI